MRKTLKSAGIGAGAGAAVGILVAIAGALLDLQFTSYLWRLLAIDGATGAYAGFLVGGLSERARAGGSRLRPAAAAALGLGAAVLIARFALDVRGLLALLVWGAAGALAVGRPRPLQFSLKSLMAFTVIVSLALAAFVNGPLKQRRLAERAVACGGRVQYATRAPGWAVELLGEVSRHWFDSLTELQLFDASDADIPRLKGLEHLERLALGGPGLTDRGLHQLASLEQLKSLELHDLPSISDEGLDRLPDLKHLEELWLGDFAIRDAGFEQLRRMPQLRKLFLYQTSITDAGFAAIEDLSELEELNMYYARNLTEASFHSLGRLKKLKSLTIGLRDTSDAAIAELKSLDALESLDLYSGKASGVGFEKLESLASLRCLKFWGDTTDEGLESIARLSHLKQLECYGYLVTDDGIAKLAALRELETFRFIGGSVTDASLEHLRGFENLNNLDFQCSKLSQAAVNRLREEMWLTVEVRQTASE